MGDARVHEKGGEREGADKSAMGTMYDSVGKLYRGREPLLTGILREEERNQEETESFC
jgi:hypothetical protein